MVGLATARAQRDGPGVRVTVLSGSSARGRIGAASHVTFTVRVRRRTGTERQAWNEPDGVCSPCDCDSNWPGLGPESDDPAAVAAVLGRIGAATFTAQLFHP